VTRRSCRPTWTPRALRSGSYRHRDPRPDRRLTADPAVRRAVLRSRVQRQGSAVGFPGSASEVNASSSRRSTSRSMGPSSSRRTQSRRTDVQAQPELHGGGPVPTCSCRWSQPKLTTAPSRRRVRQNAPELEGRTRSHGFVADSDSSGPQWWWSDYARERWERTNPGSARLGQHDLRACDAIAQPVAQCRATCSRSESAGAAFGRLRRADPTSALSWRSTGTPQWPGTGSADARGDHGRQPPAALELPTWTATGSCRRASAAGPAHRDSAAAARFRAQAGEFDPARFRVLPGPPRPGWPDRPSWTTPS